MSTGVPGVQLSLIPPAPFVSTRIFAPAAAATRTECATRRVPWPS